MSWLCLIDTAAKHSDIDSEILNFTIVPVYSSGVAIHLFRPLFRSDHLQSTLQSNLSCEGKT